MKMKIDSRTHKPPPSPAPAPPPPTGNGMEMVWKISPILQSENYILIIYMLYATLR